MSRYDFTEHLARFGPLAEYPVPSLAEAQTYCASIARTHYENFTVASWMLPRSLRTHFYNVYAYCRWADDLADETESPDESLRLLAWWEEELAALYGGRARHPVFIALRETIERFAIPRDPFVDLLAAFRRDQTQSRYETLDELLEYCGCSANPVGRIILHLADSYREETVVLSDAICTGLQLANFWQDIARDAARGRIYLPLADCRAFDCLPESSDWGRATPEFRDLLEFQVACAEGLLRLGSPLPAMLPNEIARDIELFRRGGLAVLAAIRACKFDVWSQRPVVGKLHKLWLLASVRLRWNRA